LISVVFFSITTGRSRGKCEVCTEICAQETGKIADKKNVD